MKAKLAAALVLALIGCGGRTVTGGAPDHGVRRDLGVQPVDRGVVPVPDWARPWPDRWPVPDRAVPPWPDHGLPCSTKLGTPCTSSSGCCGGLTCAQLPSGVGVCTKPCTPDDPTTPLVNEDNCPNLASAMCVNVDYPGSSHYCLQKCSPALYKASCPAGLACDPRSAALTREPKTAVCFYPGCKGPTDCPVRRSEDCNLALNTPQCVGLGPTVFCAPDLPGGAQGKCSLPGMCETTSGLCLAHGYGKPGAKVGDPCKDDLGCGGTMRCEQQSGGSSVVHARNGYCVIEGCSFASSAYSLKLCVAGSTCQHFFPGGRCFKTCDLKSSADCRGNPLDKHGDYECYDWSNLTISGGYPVAEGPTCEPADSYPCSLFQGSGIDCSALGLQPNNTTQMTCRDRVSGAVLPQHSPAGLCLDTTSSGS